MDIHERNKRCHVTIDIETIPVQDEAPKAYLTRNVRPRANLKDPEKIAADIKEKQLDIIPQTALQPLWGEIVCISWAVDDKEIRTHLRPYGTSERNYLQKVGRKLMADTTQDRLWVGFNLEFDLRFLRIRLMKHRITEWPRLPMQFKPWDKEVYDVQYQLAGTQTRGYSLDACAHAFGLNPKEDDPIMLEFYWKNGEEQRIIDYNRNDVYVTRELFKICKGGA